ncbi:uncharacterized protein FTJAE_5934 [Fusarium tjaetaba]|uniref:Uncharacterized protein n=1 Tax=Fusarium tjaetaba TaxID=1567544 RepID=A0A8H5VWB9_9HYPO|nr:uncharacterized protein FTJAE_5934 [Fusarium tjaetaba]KAF5636738.1 hypothetical protein FTJAE_5934 [Fusarium tjaetaba]
MDETPESANANDHMATLQPLLEAEPPSSASSQVVQTEKPDKTSAEEDITSSKWVLFLAQWGLEIVALALSLIAFGLMIYLLCHSADEPISKWNKTYISLNTAVSILAGTSRACLAFSISMCLSQGKWNWLNGAAQPLVDFDRFDAASRGAWGSLRLLQSCIRRPHWTLIGALTAIALLAFEPFTQAVLAIEGKEVNLDHVEYAKAAHSSNDTLQALGNVPQIGRSTRLDGASWDGAATGVSAVPFPGPHNTTMEFMARRFSFNIQEDMGMKAAIWNGFSRFTAPQNLRPAFACATGNCTWPVFPSIAVCSKCRDISEYVTKSTGPVKFPLKIYNSGAHGQEYMLEPGESLPGVSNPSPHADLRNGRNFTFIKHEISQLNLSISNYNGTPHCRNLFQQCPDTYLSARVTTNPGQTLTFRNLSTLVMAIQYLGSNETWLDNRTSWENTRVSARECALSFCVNQYHDVLSQGVLQETVASSWTDRETDSYTHDDKDVKAFMKYTNHSLDMGNQLAKLSDLQIKIPDEDYKRQASNLRQQYFNITQPTIIVLYNVLSDGFGIVRNSNDIKDLSRPYIHLSTTKLIYPALGMGQPNAGLVSGLGQSRDIPSTINNVALSLTKWIRDRELDASPMKGNATRMVVITHVRWNYLWFPGASLITGIAFAILCMWETQKLKKPALKDSILAALACAPDEELRLRLKQAAANGKLQGTGRKVEVRWEKDDEFAQFKEKKDDQPSV